MLNPESCVHEDLDNEGSKEGTFSVMERIEQRHI